MAQFLLGINYWPRTSAMAMWERFDAGEIDEDFARIAALRLDVVRFFLLWDAFQPAPDVMAREALDRFEIVMDLAHARGLRAMPTLFCGHMSGVNWLPAWTLDSAFRTRRFRTFTGGGESPFGIRDFYAGELLEPQRRFARAVGERAREHPALCVWDLGNEFSNLREPRSPSDAATWSATLAGDLRETSGAGTTGGIHAEDLTRDRNIRPSSIAAAWEFATMHGYSVYTDFARSKTDDGVVPFLCELTQSCANEAVLFSEFGNPTCPPRESDLGGFACLTETEMAAYARGVLDRVHACGALGAFWWCWADYAKELARTPPFDTAPHELRFGIVRDDGSLKPVANALGAFAAERRTVVATPPPIVRESEYYDGLPQSSYDAYDAYCAAHAESGEPT